MHLISGRLVLVLVFRYYEEAEAVDMQHTYSHDIEQDRISIKDRNSEIQYPQFDDRREQEVNKARGGKLMSTRSVTREEHKIPEYRKGPKV